MGMTLFLMDREVSQSLPSPSCHSMIGRIDHSLKEEYVRVCVCVFY